MQFHTKGNDQLPNTPDEMSVCFCGLMEKLSASSQKTVIVLDNIDYIQVNRFKHACIPMYISYLPVFFNIVCY